MSFFLILLELVTATRLGVVAGTAEVGEPAIALVHKSALAEDVDLVIAVVRPFQNLA